MKWILILAVGVAMGLAVTGCGGGGGDDNDDPLVGTWKATAFNGQALPAGISMTISLKDNGTFTANSLINGVANADTGTWSAANGVLTTVSGGEADSVPYSVSGDTLTFGTAGEVFTAKRQ